MYYLSMIILCFILHALFCEELQFCYNMCPIFYWKNLYGKLHLFKFVCCCFVGIARCTTCQWLFCDSSCMLCFVQMYHFATLCFQIFGKNLYGKLHFFKFVCFCSVGVSNFATRILFRIGYFECVVWIW